MPGISGVLLVVLGALVCFLGYRLLRVTLGLAGFAAGAFLGFLLAGRVIHASPVFVLVIAVVGGIVGAVLAAVLYKVGVFLLGATGGMFLAGVASMALSAHPNVLIIVAAGVVAGVVTLLVQKFLVSLLTALLGAGAVVAGAFQLAGRFDLQRAIEQWPAVPTGQYLWLALGSWLVLAVVGLAVQLRAGRKK